MSSLAVHSDTLPPAQRHERTIAVWLIVCCAMIFAMVVLGGVTRLTESGLSITEWQPVSGILPPLTAEQWQTEFRHYQEIPQYRLLYSDMTLAQFKGIYFWEYLHRLWGRLIGLAFALPFLWFLIRRAVPLRLVPRLAGLLVLGGLQGLLGWYMVQSGLAQRIEVSQYRLAAHLVAAVVIYAAMLWVALDLLWPGGRPAHRGLRRATAAALALVLLTMAAGAFVAGLRAGYFYNTFPLMNGAVAPAEYWQLTPWYVNWFENPAAAQFDHRLLAETTWVLTVVLWLIALRRELTRRARLAMHALALAATLQAALGIATLLSVVALPLAALHQAGAMLLVTAALVACHSLKARDTEGVAARYT